MTSFWISELADRTGVPATTLRFYEDQGLLSAKRTAAGYRLFDEADVARLAFIVSGKQLGLSLPEISELLAVHDEGICSHVRHRLRLLVADRIDQTSSRITELTAFEDFLGRVHGDLDGPAPEAACNGHCGCVIPAPSGAVDVVVTATRSGVLLPQLDESPVACTLDRSDMPDRIVDWRAVVARASRRQKVRNGLMLILPDDAGLAVEVARLCSAERQCCSFYDFMLRFTAAGLELTVRAPETGMELLTELLGVGE